MVAAIVSFQDGRKDTCLHCLRSINADVKRILQILHERLKEFDTSDEVWISYVQGLRGWGAGRPIDGKLNGLSSSGALVFEALDAFLGVEEYPIADDTMRHIPLNQRLLCRSIGSYGFGQLVDESEDLLLQDELKSIVEQLEVSLGISELIKFRLTFAAISRCQFELNSTIFGAVIRLVAILGGRISMVADNKLYHACCQ
ncbi:hypothetical protein F5Y04DRAFT_263089 [Hypomontagnella monticulosa]|nr:hypothetical protein F5Y04DRAFT_263089 [Hypomontagnella monticulosa]